MYMCLYTQTIHFVQSICMAFNVHGSTSLHLTSSQDSTVWEECLTHKASVLFISLYTSPLKDHCRIMNDSKDSYHNFVLDIRLDGHCLSMQECSCWNLSLLPAHYHSHWCHIHAYFYIAIVLELSFYTSILLYCNSVGTVFLYYKNKVVILANNLLFWPSIWLL